MTTAELVKKLEELGGPYYESADRLRPKIGVTCAEFAERWPIDFPRPDETTNTNNAYMVAAFGRDFGSRPLGDVRRQEAYAWAKEHPAASRFVKTLYWDAVNAGIVDENPFTNLRVASSVGRLYAEIPTVEQITALEAASPEPIQGMVTLAAYSMLRLGEQLGLRWSDLDGDTARVETQLDKQGHRKSLKGKSRPRTVLLPDEALEALTRAHTGSERIWPIRRWQHTHGWNKARKAVGVDFAWHCLRHAGATRWVEAGAEPRDIARLMGHRNDRLVRELYGTHGNESAAIERLRQIG